MKKEDRAVHRVEMRLTGVEVQLLDRVAAVVGKPLEARGEHRYERKVAIIAALGAYEEREGARQQVVDAVDRRLDPLGGRCYLEGDVVVVEAGRKEYRRKLGE